MDSPGLAMHATALRFLRRLPIEVTSRRNVSYTIALFVEPCSERREIVVFEAGQFGYRILHTFNGWERGRIDDMLYRDGVRVRPGGFLDRCARFLADQGLAELLEVSPG